MRRYEIQITGYEPLTWLATTRAKARYKAYLSFSEVSNCTFGDFLTRIQWVRLA